MKRAAKDSRNVLVSGNPGSVPTSHRMLRKYPTRMRELRGLNRPQTQIAIAGSDDAEKTGVGSRVFASQSWDRWPCPGTRQSVQQVLVLVGKEQRRLRVRESEREGQGHASTMWQDRATTSGHRQPSRGTRDWRLSYGARGSGIEPVAIVPELLPPQPKCLWCGRAIAEGNALARLSQHFSERRIPERRFDRLQGLVHPAMERAKAHAVRCSPAGNS